MTVTKEKKKEIVNDLRECIKEQRAIFFVNFKGMKGDSARYVRKELKNGNARMIVARKTLAKIAFDEEGIEFDPLSLEGEVGFVFGFEDGLTTAKLINRFSKEDVMTILGGVFEGDALSVEQVRNLAELPSREELLAQLMGTMKAPMGDLLRVMQGNIKGLLYVLANAKQEN